MSKTQKLVFSAFFAALICVATMIIKIPSPLFNGYLNLGDCVVLVAGWLMSPVYGFFSAAIGSMLADVLSGYMLYAPATFIIKGLMALVAYYANKSLIKKVGDIPSKIISALLAEVLMVVGYYIFEGFLYGFYATLPNALANCVQGAFGLIIGVILVKVFEKNNVLKY